MMFKAPTAVMGPLKTLAAVPATSMLLAVPAPIEIARLLTNVPGAANCNVPPFKTSAFDVAPRLLSLATAKMPLLTVVVPTYVFAPLNVSFPAPLMATLPLPETTPDCCAVMPAPAVNAMLPLLVIAVPWFSPLPKLCDCANALPAETSISVATARATAEPERFPRERVTSETATHAPSAWFQTLRYEVFKGSSDNVKWPLRPVTTELAKLDI